MRRLAELIAGFLSLYGFGSRPLRRRPQPIRIGFGAGDRFYD